MDRRECLKALSAIPALSLLTRNVQASEGTTANGAMGMLIDTTYCIGCRKCEWACKEVNQLTTDALVSYEDKSVFQKQRRPDAEHFTVVNEYPDVKDSEKNIYLKAQCMHCNDPACVSACLVSALKKEPNGAVTYDEDRCMGCRYCMIACPFQANAYEYDNVLTPRVRKCTLCFEKISEEGGVPACVAMCPPQCISFGKRKDLLHFARTKVREKPDRYIDHIYGEYEVGGTSVLYLASQPYDQLGLPILDHHAPPRLTEEIQHGIFKNFIPPLAVFILLTGIMEFFNQKDRKTEETTSETDQKTIKEVTHE